ncbi:MAG: putative TPR repeat methyltransferase [Ilumatobacter sp.]|jgi:predicted TPR repeat methyltransferase
MEPDDLDVGSGWARAPSTDSEFNRAEYDELGKHYESMVADWHYVAPSGTAKMILNHLGGSKGCVLDCACGTGLTGAALHEFGFREIIGADISAVSLAVAREKNIYTDLHEVDLQKLPLEQFADDSFDAIQCVAAMAFIEAEPMFREMCRLTRPGGVALYTQRVDLYEARGYESIEQRLASEGLWSPLECSDPQPYLPGHPEYQERILVRFHIFRVGER